MKILDDTDNVKIFVENNKNLILPIHTYVRINTGSVTIIDISLDMMFYLSFFSVLFYKKKKNLILSLETFKASQKTKKNVHDTHPFEL